MVKLPEHRTVRAFMWRARWAIWALFAAVVVRIALPGIVGAATGGELVVVLARDVKASAELIPEDLRLARIPQSALPGGALTSIDSALNHRPRTDLPSGLVLDESLLNSGSSLSDLPSGHVAVALRLTDPGLATKISAGDRIDVMASPGAGASGSIAPAQRLARSALVLEAPGEGATGPDGLGGAWGTSAQGPDQAGLLLVAVTSEEAALIGGATSWAVITAVLVDAG